MSNNVLVTGGAGFIGSNVTELLVERGYDVTVLDSLEWGLETNLQEIDRGEPGRIELIKGDIRDETLVDDIVAGVNGIFHLAGHTGNRLSIEQPHIDADHNVNGTLTLLEAAKRHAIPKLVFSSSAAIFGEVQETPVDEDHPVEPESPYGVSKLAAEKYCLCYSHLSDIDVVCLRYFNVYGKNQRYDEYGNVIPIWTKRLIDGDPLIIYGDGEQTRDFVNVQDVAAANVQAYESEQAAGPINIGTGQATRINELASIFESATDGEVEFEYQPERQGEVRHSVADVSRAEAMLDFEPEVGLDEGVAEYVDWMRTIRG